jgi:FkbM family methyltransferase
MSNLNFFTKSLLRINFVYVYLKSKFLNNEGKNKNLPPFDQFIFKNKKNALFSKFKPRYPFGLNKKLDQYFIFGKDINNRYGNEPELAHLIDLLLPDDGVFLDIGANIGYFSFFVATRENFIGKSIAFEPIKTTFDQLKKSINLLNLENIIECHNIAVSDKKTTASMSLFEERNDHATLLDTSNEPGELVQVNKIDNFTLPKVDLIKIDVEAFEKEVVDGAINTILKDKPYLFIETWKTDDDINGSKLFQKLEKHDFKFFLPSWWQYNGSVFVGVGPDFTMDYLTLIPFKPKDRSLFPGNPINVFACHASKVDLIGHDFNRG